MITEDQKQLRRQYIGSSDVSAIVGCNPYRSAEDIRLQKSGLVEDEPDKPATAAGNYLEPAVLQWAKDQLKPSEWETDVMVVHDNGIMCSNLDARGVDEFSDRVAVEGKTSGIVGPIYGNWGTEMTNEVPDMFLLQCVAQMACDKSLKCVYLAALLGGMGFKMYRIDRDPVTIDLLEKRCVKFWKDCVIGGNKAPKSMASIDIMKRLKRHPGVITPVDPEVYQNAVTAKKAYTKAEVEWEKAKIRLLNLAGQGEAISVDGVVVAEYKANKNKVRSLRLKGDLND